MLQLATYKNTPEYFPDFIKKTIPAKIIKVYDGDTFWAAIDTANISSSNNPPQIQRIKIRVARIDCPELRPKKSQKKTPEEIELEHTWATAAKEKTSSLILNKMVTLHTHDIDLYGRTIADITIPQGDLGTILISGGHAVPFMENKYPRLT